MIRVAFVLGFDAAVWLGGANYYRNLLAAIAALSDRKIDPIVFVGKSHDLALSFESLPV